MGKRRTREKAGRDPCARGRGSTGQQRHGVEVASRNRYGETRGRREEGRI